MPSPAPAQHDAENSYHHTPYLTGLKRSLAFSTVIGLIILIPRVGAGLQFNDLLMTFGSSYSIGVSAATLIWLMLRWSIPFALRRGWSALRGWALASMTGGFLATTLYSLIFAFVFVKPAERVGFFGFWLVMGAVLSLLTTGLFFGIERVQRELARGRNAIRQNAALAEELRLARLIQERLLPTAPPEVPGLLLAGGCYPAREVGGDLLSYEVLRDGRVCISVGDVAGKSVSAAMLMGVTLGALQAEIHNHEQPAFVLGEIDRWLRSRPQHKSFVALSIALIDPALGCLMFANAGQLMPLLRRDRQVQFIEAPIGLPLGMGPINVHGQELITIRPNDVFVFYTDGVVEARNAVGEMWGFDRLIALIGQAPADVVPDQLVYSIRTAIARHAAGVEQHDDITMVVVRISALVQPIP